jgi:hypothetical protein
MLTATTWVLEALTYHSLQWCSFLTRFGSGSTKYSFSDLANRQSDIHQGMDIRFVACATFEVTMTGITPTFDHGIEWIKHRISPSYGQFAPGDRPARRGSEGTGMLHLDENNQSLSQSGVRVSCSAKSASTGTARRRLRPRCTSAPASS